MNQGKAETIYQEEAFNSSLITGSEYLPADDRTVLFDFITQKSDGSGRCGNTEQIPHS